MQPDFLPINWYGYRGQVNVNAEQVKRDMAWVYDRYVTDKSLYAVQDVARAGYLGLWHDERSVPPWKWRKAKRD